MPPPAEETFVNHLSELRRRLVIAGAAVLLASGVIYFFADPLLAFLTAPIRNEVGEVFFFSPQEAFFVKLKTVFFAGLVVSSPVVLYQAWLFAAPGLLAGEKRFLLPLTAVTSLLFIGGVCFSFFVAAPAALGFLLSFGTGFLQPLISVSHYLTFLFSLSAAFGTAFNLPVVISLLTLTGLVKPRQLRAYRPHAYVLIFIAAAVLTPPDVISQALLGLPLILLYEISLLTAGLVRR